MARTGRPRGFDRNEAIRAAMNLFWLHGYESTSLAQLKAGMGDISAPSFYAAFGSKEQLFSEVITTFRATYGQVMSSLHDPTLPPRLAIETAFRNSARMQTDGTHPAGCFLVLSTGTFPPESEALKQQLASERAKTRSGLLACVQRGIAAGDLGAESKAEVIAAVFDTFLQGMTVMAREGVPFAMLDAAITDLLLVWDSHKPLAN